MTTLREEIIKIILDVCEPQQPDLSDPDSNLLTVGIDSVDFASILMAVEDTFGVAIFDEKIERLASLHGLVAFVEQKTARTSP